ncbi:MAG: 4Fe-4S dicluster domain-containing protein [Gammaproteobacteria bacterium]|nr:4Fe-4S dicluster domain-containing protein [Gammaproteobacteria bacterium]MBL6999693.1 4Fe-4S dicluster domain-containing protein [Gammaproteobacteria bacterium]
MSNTPVNPSRRGFFTATILTHEGREQVKKQLTRRGLYPPGLLSIASAENCLECTGICADSCPQNIISLHSKEHQYYGQPYLDFSNNGCTFCNECNHACPAISHKLPGPDKAIIGKAHLDKDVCHAWNGIICMSCYSVCPDKLYKFDKRRKVSIDQSPCNGCGFCIRVCPASAISIISLNANQT